MVERYRAKKTRKRPALTPHGQRKQDRRELMGDQLKVKGRRGRPLGSKDVARLKLERIQLANKKKQLLPHEFLLLVINKGLAGETLGFYINAKGEKIPNQVTFDQMMAAARSGLQYFAAPVQVHHSGPGGGPIEVLHVPQDKLVNLTVPELEFLQAVLPKLGGAVKQIEHDPHEGDADQYAEEIGMSFDEKEVV